MIKRVLVWGGALALTLAVALGIAVGLEARKLPSFGEMKSSQNGQMIVVRARDGSEIVSIGPAYGRWLHSDEIPAVMKSAMVSVEDKRFRGHIGIDPIGITRSFWVRLRDGRWRQGGSTITQQLARTVFLNNDKTWARKLREIVLAIALETRFSKDEILELYLNKVYFGGGAYGIDAASRKFFGHSASELTLPEAAIVAGLVKAPSRYSPTADAAAAVARARVVLRVMEENGAIGAGEARAVNLDAVRPAPEPNQNSARYFTDWALPQLGILLPDTNEPIEVWTTLDPGLQRAATAAVAANAPRGAQGALVSLDRDGAVLAMVGGTDYVTSNYNRATKAERQPGSAWKLFVYLAAMEAGYRPDSRVVDEPVTINGWTPRNNSDSYAGQIDLRTAFAYSKNTVAAQLGNEVGYGAVASMARRFGIVKENISTTPAMVLGTTEVRLIDMTRAFAAVAARGNSIEPYGIVKVTTTDGEVLYRHRGVQGNPLVPNYVAAGMTDLLQSAVATGTGRAAQIGRPVAGKTGTTTSNKDGWFLGFSSGITTGVWMGRDDARPVAGLQGGTAPARAFAAYMRVAVAKRPVEPFDTDLKLPDWQLEPDDAAQFADPDAYSYYDEAGNLIEIERPEVPGKRAPSEDEPQGDGGLVPVEPRPAANDDFLDQATGRDPRGAPTPAPRQDRGASPRPKQTE